MVKMNQNGKNNIKKHKMVGNKKMRGRSIISEGDTAGNNGSSIIQWLTPKFGQEYGHDET